MPLLRHHLSSQRPLPTCTDVTPRREYLATLLSRLGNPTTKTLTSLTHLTTNISRTSLQMPTCNSFQSIINNSTSEAVPTNPSFRSTLRLQPTASATTISTCRGLSTLGFTLSFLRTFSTRGPGMRVKMHSLE